MSDFIKNFKMEFPMKAPRKVLSYQILIPNGEDPQEYIKKLKENSIKSFEESKKKYDQLMSRFGLSYDDLVKGIKSLRDESGAATITCKHYIMKAINSDKTNDFNHVINAAKEDLYCWQTNNIK